MKKTRLIIFIACAVYVAFCFSGCGGDVERTAKNDIEIFNKHDPEKINELIFGSILKVDSEFQDYFTNENKSEYSVLDEIITKSTIKFLGKDEDTVKLEITAPDMEGVFSNIQGDYTDMGESDLYEHIKQYAENAESKTFTAEVPVEKQEDSIVLNYKSRSFINAITGGLLDEYRQLYKTILDQYAKDVE